MKSPVGPSQRQGRPLRRLRTLGAEAERLERLTYSVDEVASLLGISRSTAYECVRRGEIPSVRFGKRIVVLREVLDRLLREADDPVRPGE
jgi:excisionase family DNA binding protein